LGWTRRDAIVGYVTGEAKEPPLRPTFDRRIKLEFHGARITSDGGLLAYRELDHILGLAEIAITKLLDGRRGKNVRHQLGGLFRQSVFGRLAGYEDVNDAEQLARDPAMRAIVGREVSVVRPLRAARWGASRLSGWKRTPTWKP
jgi:Transposase DDE domain group 1